jgi:membrane-bound serine protease (ClpP class)
MKPLRLTTAILLTVLCVGAHTKSPIAPVHVLNVDGQIDPAVEGYLEDGIRNAEDENAQAVLVILDTPGGSLASTQKIIKAFFASRVPVIVFVYPDAAWAASAGALITMAADVAAMAPATNIGAATPVNIMPTGGDQKPDEAMKKKQVNFTTEYAKSIAERRGRNADWAGRAVRDADTISARKALRINVIDYVADSIPKLMKQMDGRKAKLLSTGKTVTLRTVGAPLDERPMGAWDTFLHYLSNPMVALFLLLGAMYGIIYELSSPGAVLPGVIGGISLILLLYSFSVIPINAAGFAFIALAIVFFIAEISVPGTGVLAFGGVLSMFFGLMMLFRSAEGFMVPIWTLAVVAIITGAFFVFLVSIGLRALRKPYVSGREGVVGHAGEAKTDLDPTGKVFVDGTLWTATSESGTIVKGERVEVTQMTGLKLTVRKHQQ